MLSKWKKEGILLLLTLLSFLPSLPSFSQNNGRISGKVVDKMSQQALPNASISLGGSRQGTVTDSTGAFRVTGLAPQTYQLTVTCVGYKALTLFNVPVSSGNESTYSIELEPEVAELGNVLIRTNRKTARAATLETPLSVQRMTAEEIRSNPGGNFDISKAIQALPGVGGGSQGGGFRNDIIIRGGAPNENVFYLDGIEIPVLNHFQTQGSSGGPQGMLNVSFIEEVKLSSSAFDARYDNTLSSVFQIRQRNGNTGQLQGNVRLSATEFAATLDGPLGADKKTTFLASARRSYLQFIFKALDLPIRPNYWDFQAKVTRQLDKKTTLSFIGLGAIDEFSFAEVKKASPEKLYAINSSSLIQQWNYTGGLTLKRLIQGGFINLAVSRNAFDNDIERFEDNKLKLPSQQTLAYRSRETENKFRLDVNKNRNGWKTAYGLMAQQVSFRNNTFQVIRKEIRDAGGTLVQPAVSYRFSSPLGGFWRYGVFGQLSKRVLNERLGISAGLRTDMNSFTTKGNNPFRQLSPRVSFSYTLADKWTANASLGRYFKIPPYTILGFADNNGILVNRNSRYQRSDHLAAGLEYLPNEGLRFTAEVFYKKYAGVPVSVRDGISLANLGSDFNVLGNEAVTTNGKGRAWGFELFAQKKLTERFFGIFSYTFFRSRYSGVNGILIPSSWDNRHLLSITTGYKFKRNWELGLKFRYQGRAPFTPYDEEASRVNFLSLGQGIFDFARLNTGRLQPFHAADIRLDKKWNFRKTTIDLFLDVTNFYLARTPAIPSYTFQRTADNSGFQSSDGQPLRPDGSNGIPVLLNNDDPFFTPTIGFIIEF